MHKTSINILSFRGQMSANEHTQVKTYVQK